MFNRKDRSRTGRWSFKSAGHLLYKAGVSGVRKFKSPWYYWYTGRKIIAVLSIVVSTLIMWGFLVVAAGFSIWGVLLAVLLDATGFWLAVIYLAFLRSCIPEFTGLHGSLDAVVTNQILVPMLVSFFITRISGFSIAKIFGYKF